MRNVEIFYRYSFCPKNDASSLKTDPKKKKKQKNKNVIQNHPECFRNFFSSFLLIFPSVENSSSFNVLTSLFDFWWLTLSPANFTLRITQMDRAHEIEHIRI